MTRHTPTYLAEQRHHGKTYGQKGFHERMSRMLHFFVKLKNVALSCKITTSTGLRFVYIHSHKNQRKLCSFIEVWLPIQFFF
jgi:hypothetical protein